MSGHVHGFLCPETPEHADTHSTPIAFDHGFAPMPSAAAMPTVEQVRAEYDAQVRSGHARGDGVTR